MLLKAAREWSFTSNPKQPIALDATEQDYSVIVKEEDVGRQVKTTRMRWKLALNPVENFYAGNGFSEITVFIGFPFNPRGPNVGGFFPSIMAFSHPIILTLKGWFFRESSTSVVKTHVSKKAPSWETRMPNIFLFFLSYSYTTSICF